MTIFRPLYPSPLDFNDFRAYLRACFHAKGLRSKQRLTIRSFSRLGGMGSPNYFNVIVHGKRNLSPSGINRFAKALGLSTFEHFLFERLVLLTQAKTEDERQYYSKTREYRLPKLLSMESVGDNLPTLTRQVPQDYNPRVSGKENKTYANQ